MKVLLIHHFFSHYREPVFRHLAASSTHSFQFYGDLTDPDGSIRPADMANWPCFELARSRRIGGRILVQAGVVRRILRRDFDAVILLGDAQHVLTWPAAMLARLLGKRVLFWTHGWLRAESGLKGWTRRVFYRLANALLLYGERARELGIAQGFRPDDLYVVYNSLDYAAQSQARDAVAPAELEALRESLFPESDAPVVICSSRLTALRRLDMLIEAARILQERGHPLNILLIGDGPERASLEVLARDAGLTVHFAGACYDEELLCRYTMLSAVTVAPGKVGLTAMQSLAFGVPVITHDNWDLQMPEAEAIEPGKSGAFFAEGDVEDLARVIENWTSTTSPCDAVKSACRAIIEEHYTPASQVVTISAAVEGIPASAVGKTAGGVT